MVPHLILCKQIIRGGGAHGGEAEECTERERRKRGDWRSACGGVEEGGPETHTEGGLQEDRGNRRNTEGNPKEDKKC